MCVARAGSGWRGGGEICGEIEAEMADTVWCVEVMPRMPVLAAWADVAVDECSLR